MIVYGDPGREESVEAMIQALQAATDRALASMNATGSVDCDALRRILVAAGELEQALFDAPAATGTRGKERWLRALRSVTSLAADAFHDACDAPRGGAAAVARVRTSLARLRSVLSRLPRTEQNRVWVQVPEGFAFDALLPEQYREAALRWAEEHAPIGHEPVLVVGIRSIGTTLSAVVTSALRACGLRARRITVRPKGRPSERRLRVRALRPAAFGLIVDEGPGPSGSSVLAVADALARAGIERIHVFPGHERGPGSQATVETLERWKSLPSYCGARKSVRVGDEPLAEALWRSIDPEGRDPLRQVLPCHAGAWRSIRYDHPTAWPAVCGTLERPKLLGEGASGRRVLFKFAGFATAPGTSLSLAEVHAQKLTRLADRGFTPPPVSTAHGFVATDWLEGRALSAADARPDLIRRIGCYVAAASGPPLSVSAARGARNRVETMLSVNTSEALGDDAAAVALSLFRPVAVLENMPRSGDGHMAPHEWIETPDGRVQKTDAGGHELDPTWTGRQPVLWDLAGAILEWDLSPSMERELLGGFTQSGGYPCAPLALDAYRAAYAAHRIGQVRMARDLETDRDEQERLESEYERWRGKLQSCFAEGLTRAS